MTLGPRFQLLKTSLTPESGPGLSFPIYRMGQGIFLIRSTGVCSVCTHVPIYMTKRMHIYTPIYVFIYLHYIDYIHIYES